MKKLKVDKSKIAGKGLFTTDTFEQGEMIGLAHENDQPSTFIGKYHNHSDEPNAVSIKLGNKRYIMAKRPLKKGEEITTNYRLQPELEQPEDFAKGGLVKMPKPSKQGLASKKFSKSLDATNRLFTENYLFSKHKSKKRKVFDPNAKYEDGGFLPMAEYGMPMGGGMSQNYQGRTKFIHQDGGELDCPPGYAKDEYGNCMRVQNTEPVTVYNSKQYDGVITQRDINNANNAMMKARLAYADMHGNPAAQRMVVAQDQPYEYTGDEYDQLWGQPVGAEPGMIGTHYMASFGNYAVPFIQQGPNGLYFNEAPSVRDREAIRFDNEDDAQYFGEHYKEVTPDESYIQEEYAAGGVAFPLDLNPETMKKYREVLKVQENSLKS